MTIAEINRFLPEPVLGSKLSCLKVYFPASDSLSETEIEEGPDLMIISGKSGPALLEYRFGTIITYWYDEDGRKVQTKEVSDTEEKLCTYEYAPDGGLYHKSELILSTFDPLQEGKTADLWISWEKHGQQQICLKELIERYRYNQTVKRKTTAEWFNDAGMLLDIKEWEDYNGLVSSVKYEYSDNGDLLEQREYDRVGRLIRYEKHKYQKNGCIRETYIESLVQVPLENDSWEDKTIYFDENGLRQRLVNHSTGKTEQCEYTYDEDGDWVLCRITDSDGGVFRVLRVFENWG